MNKILIIKHGAFGDIIKAIPALNAILHHYNGKEISLLTSGKFNDLIQKNFKFSNIIKDSRSKNFCKSLEILRAIKAQQYDLIVDLQNSRRTNYYFYILKYLLGNQSKWSGTAYRCDYYMPVALKKSMHTVERFTQQLSQLGINITDYQYKYSTSIFNKIPLPHRFALIIPGCSATSVEKKWSLSHYIQVVGLLKAQAIDSVFIGGPEEIEISNVISQNCPLALNLINQISINDILPIASQAQVIIGNDTGPLYLAQLSGRPTCVLWSNHSDPKLHAPLGKNVHILQNNVIDQILPNQVMNAVKNYIA